MTNDSNWLVPAVLWGIGVVIGIGQLMADSNVHPVRRYVGHGLVSGGLASVAGAVLLLIPNAPIIAVMGLAAGLATMGTVALRDLAVRYLEHEEDQNEEVSQNAE